MDLSEFGKMLLVLCGGLITLAEAGKVVYNMVKPGLSLKKRVEKLEEITPDDISERVRRLEEAADPDIKTRIERIEGKLDADYRAIEKIHSLQAGLCNAIISIIDHEITGDHIQALEEKKDDLLARLANNF